MGKEKNFVIFISAFILIFLNLADSVSGFGISPNYYRENPLIINPGETREIIFGELQNSGVKNNGIVLKAEILKGQEIAVLNDKSNEYKVDFGLISVPVKMKISIPENAELGTEYSVNVKFSEIPGSEKEGMVTATSSITVSMPVFIQGISREKISESQINEGKIYEKKEANAFLIISLIWTFFILILIALIFIIFLILKKRFSAK